MSLAASLRFIRQHPIGRLRTARCMMDWLRWQVGSRLVPGPVIAPWVGSAKLVVVPGMTGATGNLYVGLHEFEEMAFVAHLLRESDLFVDVGANVGTFSVLAAAVSEARCIAFEPHPETCARLIENLRINHLERLVEPRQRALGSAPGSLPLTADLDTVNHLRADGESVRSSVMVPVSRLSDELGSADVPTLIKIDVEGFETNVINGAQDVLGQEDLLALVIELNGSGARYGFSEQALRQRVLDCGFRSFRYDPFHRALSATSDINHRTGNAVFVREKRLDAVKGRLLSAPALDVKGVLV